MGAITKRHNSIWTLQRLTEGEADTVAVEPLIEGHGAIVTRRLLNGATAPTVEAQLLLEISHDNSVWFQFSTILLGTTTNNADTRDVIEIPEGVKYLRFTAGSNTVQDAFVSVDVTEVT